MFITPMTRLEAVNEIISSIGEAPVNTLENVTSVDVINANRILDVVSRDIQVMGWTFNRVPQMSFQPDTYTKQIAWNDDILLLSTDDGNIYRNRGGVFFNVTEQTDIFDSPVVADVYLFTPFEEMPEVFRNFVTAKASKLFASRYLGDEGIIAHLAEQEAVSWANIMEYEHSIERNNYTQNIDIINLMRR